MVTVQPCDVEGVMLGNSVGKKWWVLVFRMKFIERLRLGYYERRRQDIEATIEILKGRFGKFYSFMLLWYPFRGSVKDHILYLENQLVQKGLGGVGV